MRAALSALALAGCVSTGHEVRRQPSGRVEGWVAQAVGGVGRGLVADWHVEGGHVVGLIRRGQPCVTATLNRYDEQVVQVVTPTLWNWAMIGLGGLTVLVAIDDLADGRDELGEVAAYGGYPFSSTGGLLAGLAVTGLAIVVQRGWSHVLVERQHFELAHLRGEAVPCGTEPVDGLILTLHDGEGAFALARTTVRQGRANFPIPPGQVGRLTMRVEVALDELAWLARGGEVIGEVFVE